MDLNKNILLLFIVICQFIAAYSKKQVYRVNDETEKDEYLGNVAQDFNLPSLSRTDPPRLYVVVSGKEYVRVDNTTGDLHTVIRLDRESLCPQNPRKCRVDAEILVSPKRYFQVLKVQLQIDDLNDNVPTFPNNPIVVEISESTRIGSVIRLDSAIDPDLGKNSIKRYKVASSPPGLQNRNGTSLPYFDLNVRDNIGGMKIPELRLTEELDREKISSYSLLLFAIDGGNQARTGTATVSILVTDSNDNQPFFNQKNYVVKVEENVKVGAAIVQVKATDLDDGPNALIEYSFDSLVSKQDRAIFNLNSSTGVITIQGPGLDYENKTIHHLLVEAKDGGPSSASTTVTVKVLDVNDEYPQIDIDFIDNVEISHGRTSGCSDPNPILIKENLQSGTYLAFVSIKDRDTGTDGKVACKLTDSTIFDLKTLDKNDNRYYIETKGSLDREANRCLNIEVIAWDYGRPSLNSSKTVAMELLDENDNDPIFAKDIFHFTVPENVEPNGVVVKLAANDVDDGDNARITYESRPLSGSGPFPFAIDPDSGEVKYVPNAPKLDAEKSPGPFEMIVTATDHGTPPRSTNTTVVISVLDENDNSPKFEETNYVFRISEDAKLGQFVGSVKAHDNDIDKETNGRITYSFNSDRIPFSIKPTTGEISFVGNEHDLDREARQAQPYHLTVTATDNGLEPMSDHCSVEIYLVDVNDNSPHVLFPNVTKDIFYLYITSNRANFLRKRRYLSEDSSMNESVRNENLLKRSLLIGSSGSKNIRSPEHVPVVITTIKAEDPDEGENGRVHFVLSAGNRQKYFAVDSESGNVILKVDNPKSLLKMVRGCHVIEVIAKDAGMSAQESPTWVNIYLTEKNPGTLNASAIMKECMNNSNYPPQYLPHSEQSSAIILEWWMIIIIAVVGFLVLLFIVIIIVVRCKKRRRKPGTYCCKKKADLYGSTKYSSGLSMQLMKGKDASEKLANGTVDSRQSFAIYTEAPAQTEKDPLRPNPDNSRESIHSHDSGTGDSMPSDAYHNAVSRQPPTVQSYPTHQGEFFSPQASMVDPYYQQPFDGINKEDHDGSIQMYSRCTDECRLHGHSDMCWMPETGIRPSSRLASVPGLEEHETGSLRKRSMTPTMHQRPVDSMRLPPSSHHSFRYYDPVNRYESNSSHPSAVSFREDYVDSDAGSGRYPRMVSSIPVSDMNPNFYPHSYPSHEHVAHSPFSQPPSQFNNPSVMSYSTQHQGGNYINQRGAGYNVDRRIPEDTPSYISSASSGVQYPGYPAPGNPVPVQYSQMQGYPGQYMASYPEEGYEITPGGFVEQSHGFAPAYEEDFSASNLLLSPAYTEPSISFSHGPERQMPYHSMGRPEEPSDFESEPKPTADSGYLRDDVDAPNDKLGTIKEMDADEVVAKIDELLL